MSAAPERRNLSRTRGKKANVCNTCRQRKVRCDRREPCATCLASNHDCVYSAEESSMSKTYLILSGVLRIEKYLQENSMIVNPSISSFQHSDAAGALHSSSSIHSVTTTSHKLRTPGDDNGGNSVQNATLSSLHTSTTESILEWPHFDHFTSLREGYKPIFNLEQSRTQLMARPSDVTPYLSHDEVRKIIQSFQSSINFCYPTISKERLETIQNLMLRGSLDYSVESCLALVIMALGCASQCVSSLLDNPMLSVGDNGYHQSRRSLAEMFFDSVLKRLYIAHSEVTQEATQCLFYIALYYAYLQRPLQSWSYINTAAARCRLLLSYPPSDSWFDSESVRRIFWSCFIMESDHLAELSALPLSGIASIESSIPLPGDYNTHFSPHSNSSSPHSIPTNTTVSTPGEEQEQAQEQELSALYFLACLSMRRLLNRVHDLLYSPSSGASGDTTRFPAIVAELSHQLEEWRKLLPATFQFVIDTNPVSSPHGGFLRQRYLTCKSVIYRPYLTWFLTTWDGDGDRETRDRMENGELAGVTTEMADNCGVCLDAILLHILNLKASTHKILLDTWICSLSMAGGMLILLAAAQNPSLRLHMGDRVNILGPLLKDFISRWMYIPGDAISPSIEQSLRLICDIDGLIRNEYMAGI